MQATNLKHSRGELAVAASIFSLAAVFLLLLAYMHGPKDTDFPSFYAAGRAVLQKPTALYSPSAQAVAQLVINGNRPWRFEPFAHLPIEALLVSPFAHFKPINAYFLWTLANLLAVVLLLWLLRKSTTNYVALPLILIPAIAGLNCGQNHILPAICTLMLCRESKRGRQMTAGVFLGLLLLRFQFAIPLAVFFVVARRWRLLAAAAIVGSAVLASSFLIAGPHFLSDYLKAGKALQNLDEAVMRQMIGIRAMVTVLIPNRAVALSITTVLAVSLLAWGLRIWKREPWAPESDRFDLLFALAVFVSSAISFHAFMYDLTTVGVAAAIATRRMSFTVAQACLFPFFLIPFLPSETGWPASIFLVGGAALLRKHLSSGSSTAIAPGTDQHSDPRLFTDEPRLPAIQHSAS